MYKNLKCIAFIPARKNSKGLKNKNLRKINGKSLFELTLLSAIESKIFDLVVVSSDSSEVLKIAKKYDVSISGVRPDYLSSDEAKTIDVVRYEAKLLNFDSYDCIVLLQPTSPFRTKEDIIKSLEIYFDSNLSSVLSVTESKEKIHLVRKINKEGRLEKILETNSNIRRQDASKFYSVNGAIYVNSVNEIKNPDFGFNDNLVPYFMSSERSIDIDNLDDLKSARSIYRKFTNELF